MKLRISGSKKSSDSQIAVAIGLIAIVLAIVGWALPLSSTPTVPTIHNPAFNNRTNLTSAFATSNTVTIAPTAAKQTIILIVWICASNDGVNCNGSIPTQLWLVSDNQGNTWTRLFSLSHNFNYFAGNSQYDAEVWYTNIYNDTSSTTIKAEIPGGSSNEFIDIMAVMYDFSIHTTGDYSSGIGAWTTYNLGVQTSYSQKIQTSAVNSTILDIGYQYTNGPSNNCTPNYLSGQTSRVCINPSPLGLSFADRQVTATNTYTETASTGGDPFIGQLVLISLVGTS